MAKYINKVNLELWDNSFSKELNFNNGLNIISGTNGTGKTKLLQFIQQHNNNDQKITMSDGTFITTISAFSPQRNAQKVTAQQALQTFRQDINATENAYNTFRNKLIQDDGFQTLKPIPDYIVYSAEEKVKSDDIKPSEAANQVRESFESILKRVFDFELKFELNKETKSYDLFFEKNGVKLSPLDLSHGENAVIVLMCALLFGKDTADTFLIDEPETHLNWSLEEKLFEFFDWFCAEYEKQIITVTHSRVIFLEKYQGKRQFFERQGKDITVSDQPSKELIKQLAGDTVNLLQGITTKTKLVYVEDLASKTVLESICQKLNLEIEVEIAGDCEKVKNISRAFKNLSVENVYFLIDGDNKPLTKEEAGKLHKNTIKLNKYCIENYLLNSELLNLYKAQDWEAALKTNINAIQVNSNPNIKPIQIALDKSATVSELIDYIDGSKIFEKLAETENKKDKKYDFMTEIINKSLDEDIFIKYFPELVFLQN